jgi:hypothetical protein
MADHDDILTNKQRIESKIQELETHRDSIFDASKDKATALSEYDKEIALTILKLKNGNIKNFEGEEIPDPCPITIMKDIAKGICYLKSFKKEEKDGAYKGLVVIIDSIKAELNGLQSINKHLE